MPAYWQQRTTVAMMRAVFASLAPHMPGFARIIRSAECAWIRAYGAVKPKDTKLRIARRRALLALRELSGGVRRRLVGTLWGVAMGTPARDAVMTGLQCLQNEAPPAVRRQSGQNGPPQIEQVPLASFSGCTRQCMRGVSHRGGGWRKLERQGRFSFAIEGGRDGWAAGRETRK